MIDKDEDLGAFGEEPGGGAGVASYRAMTREMEARTEEELERYLAERYR